MLLNLIDQLRAVLTIHKLAVVVQRIAESKADPDSRL
jgi:hypothetical protein